MDGRFSSIEIVAFKPAQSNVWPFSVHLRIETFVCDLGLDLDRFKLAISGSRIREPYYNQEQSQNGIDVIEITSNDVNRRYSDGFRLTFIFLGYAGLCGFGIFEAVCDFRLVALMSNAVTNSINADNSLRRIIKAQEVQ